MINAASALLSTDLAIDLGTANTVVFARNQGIILNQPSVVAVNTKTGHIEAVGADAKQMIGRTPDTIEAIKPLRRGVIANFAMAERMLNHFVKQAQNTWLPARPRIIIGVPGDVTPVERRAVLDSAWRARAREVTLVDQAMMAALGAGLPITQAAGSMVLDIGGGTADVAVISLSGVVYSRSLPAAGDSMDEAIIELFRRRHSLLIGAQTAERVKIAIGSAQPLENTLHAEVKGRDLFNGVPKTITTDDAEIREAIAPVVAAIVGGVRQALEHTPPELSGDILEKGLLLTGGGSLLKRLDDRIRCETGISVMVAADPLTSVVAGTGKLLSDPVLARRLSLN